MREDIACCLKLMHLSADKYYTIAIKQQNNVTNPLISSIRHMITYLNTLIVYVTAFPYLVVSLTEKDREKIDSWAINFERHAGEFVGTQMAQSYILPCVGGTIFCALSYYFIKKIIRGIKHSLS